MSDSDSQTTQAALWTEMLQNADHSLTYTLLCSNGTLVRGVMMLQTNNERPGTPKRLLWQLCGTTSNTGKSMCLAVL